MLNVTIGHPELYVTGSHPERSRRMFKMIKGSDNENILRLYCEMPR